MTSLTGSMTDSVSMGLRSPRGSGGAGGAGDLSRLSGGGEFGPGSGSNPAGSLLNGAGSGPSSNPSGSLLNGNGGNAAASGSALSSVNTLSPIENNAHSGFSSDVQSTRKQFFPLESIEERPSSQEKTSSQASVVASGE